MALLVTPTIGLLTGLLLAFCNVSSFIVFIPSIHLCNRSNLDRFDKTAFSFSCYLLNSLPLNARLTDTEIKIFYEGLSIKLKIPHNSCFILKDSLNESLPMYLDFNASFPLPNPFISGSAAKGWNQDTECSICISDHTWDKLALQITTMVTLWSVPTCLGHRILGVTAKIYKPVLSKINEFLGSFFFFLKKAVWHDN